LAFVTAAEFHRLARAAMGRGDAAGARHAIASMLAADPDYAPGWLTVSLLELDLGHGVRALEAATRGMALGALGALGAPEPALRVQLVRCLHATGQLARARAAVVEAEPHVLGHPPLQHELGNACAALGEYESALRLMSLAAGAHPDDPAIAYNKAAVLRYLGRFGEAEACLDSAIEAAPHDGEAWLARSLLRTQTASRNHVASLHAALAQASDRWPREVQLRYALAKEYEDLGADALSFQHLDAGARRRRRNLHYDAGSDIAAMEHIRAHFGRDYLARASSPHDAAPIFIFGLPRSGTTLIDRILGSHPDVVSLGELNEFPSSVIACANTAGGAAGKLDLIARAAEVPAGDLGAAYLARVAEHAPASAVFIDKLPMNYLYAGLIAAALPRARLVHVSRHPMANAYAMYKTLFQQGYPFSYDLRELGGYVGGYTRLMAHWRDVLGARLISVRYEDVAADPERQIRQLVSACGLPWHDACLAPHRNPAPSATQSAVQVRQPISAAAIDQWRRFARHLAPLRARLLAEGLSEAELA
jgi:tetratricopeptide (TPR) repeat protein